MEVKEPESKFLKISCSECENEQVVFNKPSKQAECLKCGEILCEPTGGMGKIKTKIEEVFR